MLSRARAFVASLIVCGSVLMSFFASARLASAAEATSGERIDELLLELQSFNLSRRSDARDTLLEMNRAYLTEHLIKSLDSPGSDFATVRLLVEIGDDSIAPLVAVLERRVPLLDRWKEALETTKTPPPVASVPLDEFADARCDAAMALVALGKKPVPKLIMAMRSSNAITRAYVAKILGKSGDSRAVSTLIEALGDEAPAVRWNAAWSLGTLGRPTAIRPLIDADAAMKAAAAGATTSTTAALSPAERSPEALAAYAEDIRVTIMDALARFEDPRAFRHLSTSLDDASTRVRLAAARAIASSADKRSGDILAGALDDADRFVRAEAAFGLGDRLDDRAAAELTAIVRGGYGAVWRAARLLGALEHKPAAAALVSAFGNSDSSARGNAVEAVGILGAKQYVPQVAALLKDSSYRVRVDTILALEKLDPEEAAVKIAPLLEDPSMEPRGTAAKALGRLGDKRAVDALVKAVKDIKCDCRVEAAVSLGKIKDQRAVEPLVEIFKTSNNKRLHEACTAALVELKSPEATRLLLGLLTDGESNVRAVAAKSLEGIADVKSFDALVNATKDQDPLVRKRALWALTSFPGPGTIGIMAAALGDADDQVANAAQGALREMADPRAIEPVANILKTGNDDMRVRAAKVLGMMKAPEAVPPLIAALKDPIQAVRARAAWSLEDCGDPRAVVPLLPLLGDPFVEVRCAAAWVLIVHDDPAAVGALISALDDPDIQVRRGAATSLGNIGGDQAVTALISALNDPVPDVRWCAALALSLCKDPRSVEPLITVFTGQRGFEKGAILLALAAVDTPRARNAVDSMVEGIDVKNYADNYGHYIEKSRKRDIFALSAALVLYGDYEMARDYRWSAHNHFIQMAYFWGKPRGLEQKLRDATWRENPSFWHWPKKNYLTVSVEALADPDVKRRRRAVWSIGLVFEEYAPHRGEPMLARGEPAPELAVFWDALEPPVREHKHAEDVWQAIAMHSDDRDRAWTRSGTAPDQLIAAVDAVARVLVNDKSQGVRKEAARALGRSHDPIAVRPLVRGLNDAVVDVRKACVSSLGLIGTAEAVDVIIDVLADTDDSVRARAVYALGLTSDPRAFGIILESIKDDSEPEMQMQAAAAFGEIADERVVQPLRDALKSRNGDVRAHAAWVLGNLHEGGSVDVIANLLYEENIKCISYAARALYNIGTAAALRELDTACGDYTLAHLQARYAYYIRRGREEDVDALVIALAARYESDAVADYFWCGHPRLAEAARITGYREDPPRKPHGPRWGALKDVKEALGEE